MRVSSAEPIESMMFLLGPGLFFAPICTVGLILIIFFAVEVSVLTRMSHLVLTSRARCVTEFVLTL
jgi:hypothetical protein